MKPIEIYIENPCSEDWTKMKTTDQGKFCLACQKEVIDFTNFNQAQFKYYFEINYKIKNQSVENKLCGRFLTKDVYVDNLPTPNQATRPQTIKIKYKSLSFSQIFILSFFFLLPQQILTKK